MILTYFDGKAWSVKTSENMLKRCYIGMMGLCSRHTLLNQSGIACDCGVSFKC